MTWNGINETMQQLPWFCIIRTFVLREEKRERVRNREWDNGQAKRRLFYTETV